MKVSVKSVIFKIGLIGLFLSGSFYGIKKVMNYQQVTLVISLMVICLACGKLCVTFKKKPDILGVTYYLFMLSIVISFLVHLELSMLITVAGLFLIWFATTVQVPLFYRESKKSYDDETVVVILVLLFFLILSLALGFTTYRFQGVFDNSNFTGGEAATLSAVALAYFLQELLYNRSKRKLRLLLSIFSVVLSLVVGFASNSRTACAIIIIQLFLVAGLMIKETKKINRRKILFALLFIAVVGIFLYNTEWVSSAIDEVVTKVLAREGNLLAGRQDRWDIVFNRFRFWGNGEAAAFGTHNTFLSMLDQYGLLACIFLCLFVCIGIVKSIKLAFSNGERSMKFLPLLCFVSFGLSSMLEQMMLKNIMLLCMYVCPLIMYLEKKEKRRH